MGEREEWGGYGTFLGEARDEGVIEMGNEK